MVTWSEIKWRICFAPELPPPPQRDWERDALHPPCKSVKSVSSVGNEPFAAYENTLHLCLRITGRKILVSSRLGPRMESAVNMNEQAHDNMSASHGRCENGKWTKNAGGKEWLIKNNPLNINLMYSPCFCTFVQQTVRLSLKPPSFGEIEISLHYHKEDYMQLCSYTVMQFFFEGCEKGWKEILLYI